MYRNLLLTSCFLLIVYVHSSGQQKCAFDEKLQELLATNPEYAKTYIATEQSIRNYIAKHPAGSTNSRSVAYTIPVVVHVMHTGGAIGSIYNPSDATLQGFITYLNQVFAGTYPGMEAPTGGGGIVNMELTFAFAQRTPSCGYTNGIDRVNASSIPNYSTNGVNANNSSGCTDLQLKDFARWNPSDYYNIWIVNKIDGVDGTSGQFIAGYAYFAGAPASVDGTVMLATQAVAGNKVLPHEIGHAFNLHHPFYPSTLNTSCPVNTNCGVDGDGVCDTDPITNNVNGADVYDFSCRTGINTCTGTPYTNNTEHNFMSYTNCFTLFTNDQKARVQAAMTLPSRASLGTSLGETPCGKVVNFTAATDVKTENNAGTVIDCRKYTDYSYQMSIGEAPTANATVTLNYSGSATNGVDYIVITGNTLTFPVGSTALQTFTVRVFDDAATEPAETAIFNFTVTGGGASMGTTFPTFTLNINDNDLIAVPPSTNTQTIGISAGNIGAKLFDSKLQSKRVQMLYKASELSAAGITAGSMTGMSFNILAKNSTRPFTNLTIKMGGTTLANLSDGASVTAIGGLATVKNPFTYSTTVGYNNFTFDAPFTWNGIDNVVVELCYDNGTADATQTSDETIGYSDCGTCPTGNMFWQDGINCAGSFGMVSLFPNNVKPQIKLTQTFTGSPIATALNTIRTAYLGPNEDVYFYNGSGDIMARVKNLTAFDYGCTTIQIDRAGNGTTAFWNNTSANYLSNKSFQISPSNANPSGQYDLVLYYSGAEKMGYEAATGKPWSGISIVKTAGPISGVTPGNPQPSTVTLNNTLTQASFGLDYTVKGTFNNGFSGVAVGDPGTADACTIALTSATGSDGQTVCSGTEITNITYATPLATGANFSGLPMGVTGLWSANVVTISGTPSESGPFNYVVTLVGTGCAGMTKNGLITVNQTPSVTLNLTSGAGTDGQTVCINTPITDITYLITGPNSTTWNGTIPDGVIGNLVNNVLTFSGTPTVSSNLPFDFMVQVSGSCGSATANISIMAVGPDTNMWIGPAIGNWNDSVINWSRGFLPVTCDDVVIPSGKSVTLPSTDTGNCNTIHVEIGGFLLVEQGSLFTVMNP